MFDGTVMHFRIGKFDDVQVTFYEGQVEHFYVPPDIVGKCAPFESCIFELDAFELNSLEGTVLEDDVDELVGFDEGA